MPEKFTLGELQKTYEIILGKSLDKRNFRKKILSLGLVSRSNEKVVSGAHRPAELYQFIEKKLKNLEIL
jgi:8-oxo-dGTP diphosphatase